MDASATATKDERTLAMFSHLLGFAGYVVPFGNLIGPLVVWQVKKDESAYVAAHAKEALNFQISTTIYALACAALALCLIGIPLLLALVVFEIVVMVTAAIRANEGAEYRYPLCIRLVS